jgi:hypothetical protein
MLRESRKHLSLQAWILRHFAENALSHFGVSPHARHDASDGCWIP